MFYFSLYQLMAYKGGIKIVSKQIVLKWLQNKFMNPVKCKNDVIQWKNASLCNNKKTATSHYLMTPYKSRLATRAHLHQRFASIKRSLCCSNVLKGNDVAQLTERSLPTPQDQCLIPSIANLCQHLLLISL